MKGPERKRRLAKQRYNTAIEVMRAHGYSMRKPPPTSDKMLTEYYQTAQECYKEISGRIPEKPRKKKKKKTTVDKIRRAKRKANRRKDKPANIEWLPRDEWERQTEKFYKSQRWKELRYDTLRRYAGACSCCGARASDGVQIHVDHIKPRSKYPELQYDPDNLQLLCEDCNFGKSNYYNDDWRVKMEG